MKPVTLYTTISCGFCRRAKEFLQERGVPYTEIDVTGDDAAREKLVEKARGMRTVPQIFIGEHHIGGYTDMMSLHLRGTLRTLLEDPGQEQDAPPRA
jgi:glutaredoxin 3